MNEEWIRTMAATHVDVGDALAEVPRLVHLAVRLAAVSNALAGEVRRLQPIEQRARDELTGANLHAAVVAERILGGES